MINQQFDNSWRGKPSLGDKRIGELLGTNFKIVAYKQGRNFAIECLTCGDITTRHSGTFSQVNDPSLKGGA